MDAGQTRTNNPRNTDGDAMPDFRDLDSNGDGTFDVTVTAPAGSRLAGTVRTAWPSFRPSSQIGYQRASATRLIRARSSAR